MLAHTWFAWQAWVSIFLGWLAKILILRYGGVRLYRAARPVFLGLIVGEVLAAAYWIIDPAVRVALGKPYLRIYVIP